MILVWDSWILTELVWLSHLRNLWQINGILICRLLLLFECFFLIINHIIIQSSFVLTFFIEILYLYCVNHYIFIYWFRLRIKFLDAIISLFCLFLFSFNFIFTFILLLCRLLLIFYAIFGCCHCALVALYSLYHIWNRLIYVYWLVCCSCCLVKFR